jgi:protein deglycase
MNFALVLPIFLLMLFQTSVLSLRTVNTFSKTLNRVSTKLNMSSSGSTSKKVLVAVADGTEEIEAVTIIDTLVRAGASVTTASVKGQLQVTCSRGVKLVADKLISECTHGHWDLVCLPGGMPGAEHLRDSRELQEILTKQNTDNKLVAAICAAPAVALQPLGILNNKRATCYPGRFRGMLQAEYTSDDAVVKDHNVITSQGPGTSLKFALKLVESLYGAEMKEKLKREMLADL